MKRVRFLRSRNTTYYLDKISSKFAKEIENFTNPKTQAVFMRSMFEEYCRPVNKHSIIDYVNGQKIDLAKHLLKTTSLQVQTIAHHCGFLDMQYFSKVFKKYTGYTPRAYREKKRTQNT